jgi:hypothetical protein
VIRRRLALLAVGAALGAIGLLALPGAYAQQAPPPSSPPELGLPPATARPAEAKPPAVTAPDTGASSGTSREADDESFGSAVVGTFTEPGRLVGALLLALGLGLAVSAVIRFRNHRRRSVSEPREPRPRAPAQAAPAKRELHERQSDRAARARERTGRRASSSTSCHRSCAHHSLP